MNTGQEDEQAIGLLSVKWKGQERIGVIVDVTAKAVDTSVQEKSLVMAVAFPEGDVYRLITDEEKSVIKRVKSISLSTRDGDRYEIFQGVSSDETISTIQYDALMNDESQQVVITPISKEAALAYVEKPETVETNPRPFVLRLRNAIADAEKASPVA